MAQKKLDIIVQARDDASRKFGTIGKNTEKLTRTFGKLSAAIGGIAIGATVAKSLKAFATQQAAEQNLANALENLGVSSDRAKEDMFAFASSIQRVTTVGDEAVLEIATLGAAMGGLSGRDLQRATRAAIGFSQALKVDMKTAMTLVAKAAQGNTTSFTRYGVTVDKTASKQEQFNSILVAGEKHFKLAEGAAQTLEGQYKQFTNAVGDSFEIMGQKIVEVFGLIKKEGESSIQALTRSVGELNQFFAKEGSGSEFGKFLANSAGQSGGFGLFGFLLSKDPEKLVDEATNKLMEKSNRNAKSDLQKNIAEERTRLVKEQIKKAADAIEKALKEQKQRNASKFRGLFFDPAMAVGGLFESGQGKATGAMRTGVRAFGNLLRKSAKRRTPEEVTEISRSQSGLVQSRTLTGVQQAGRLDPMLKEQKEQVKETRKLTKIMSEIKDELSTGQRINLLAAAFNGN